MTAEGFHDLLQGKENEDPSFLPQGFGILAKGWMPRRLGVGTVDLNWIRSGRHLPEDFDFAIWNAAPPDQQCPCLLGGATLTLVNLCRKDAPGASFDTEGNTVLRINLPRHLPFLLVRGLEGELTPIAMDLDTVSLDPEQASVVLVWRCVLPFEAGIETLEARMMDEKDKARFTDLDAWLDQELDRYRAEQEAAAAAAEGVVHG